MIKYLYPLLFILIFPFSLLAQDYSVVYSKRGKFGIQDNRTGKLIVPYKYDGLYESSEVENLFIAQIGNKWGMITGEEKVILPIEYGVNDSASDYSGATFILDGDAYFPRVSGFVLQAKNGKWGLINYKTQILVPFEYDAFYEIGWSSKDLYKEPENKRKDGKIDLGQNYIVQKNGQWGIINSMNEVQVPFQYQNLVGFAGNVQSNEYAIVEKEGEFLLIDKDGKKASFDTNQEMALYEIGGKIGVFKFSDEEAGVISPPKYDFANINRFDISIELNGKHGLMDFGGKVLFACQYDSPFRFDKKSAEARTFVSKNGKYALLTREGTFITNFTYTDYSKGQPNAVKKGGKWGYIDENGQVLIPFQFKTATGFGESALTPVKKGSKFGYINRKGEVLIPFKYNKAYAFKKGKATIVLNGKRGFIDEKGQESW